MGKWKDKNCHICDKTFSPSGPSSKYCSNCQGEGRRRNALAGVRAYRKREAVKSGTLDRFGIGRGGGQLTGRDSPHYKNGIKYFHDSCKQIKEGQRYCERCNKDLKNAEKGFWCVHHRDHNRTNNIDEKL